MRFLMAVKATKDSEDGVMPTQEQLETMGKYNEELVKAGVLLEAAGLYPSSKSVRVKLDSNNRKVVVDGPFTETKELISGFWIIQVKSKEEAIEWAKRVPMSAAGPAEIELRQFFDIEDFGAGPGTDRARELGEKLASSKK